MFFGRDPNSRLNAGFVVASYQRYQRLVAGSVFSVAGSRIRPFLKSRVTARIPNGESATPEKDAGPFIVSWPVGRRGAPKVSWLYVACPARMARSSGESPRTPMTNSQA